MEKVINLHMVKGKRPYYDIYIGRELHYPKATFPQSKWANPFITRFMKISIDENLELYEKHIKNSPKLWNALHELEGKILGCWCINSQQKDKIVCHGQILIKLLEEKEKKN